MGAICIKKKKKKYFGEEYRPTLPTGRVHAVARDTRPPNNARPLVQMADRCMLLEICGRCFP